MHVLQYESLAPSSAYQYVKRTGDAVRKVCILYGILKHHLECISTILNYSTKIQDTFLISNGDHVLKTGFDLGA